MSSFLAGKPLPHPYILSFWTVVLGTAAYSLITKPKQKIDSKLDDPLRQNQQHVANHNKVHFNTGLRLGRFWEYWTPYIVKKGGYEKLYNMVDDFFRAPQLARGFMGLIERHESDPLLAVECMGLPFEHPIGLGAGWVRDGKSLQGLLDIGFSFVECGTATLYPQPGNPPRRLFELPDDRGFINNSGSPNPGARVLAENLERWYKKRPVRQEKAIVGCNIALNSTIDPLSDIEHNNDGLHNDNHFITPSHGKSHYYDFLQLYNILAPFVHYFVINVSEREAFIQVKQDEQSVNNNNTTNDSHNTTNIINQNLIVNQLKQFYAQHGIDEEMYTAIKEMGIELPLPPFMINSNNNNNNVDKKISNTNENNSTDIDNITNNFTIHPNYIHLLETLFNERSQGQQFPWAHGNLESKLYDDVRMYKYRKAKFHQLQDEYRRISKQIDDLMGNSLNQDSTTVGVNNTLNATVNDSTKIESLSQQRDVIQTLIDEQHEFIKAYEVEQQRLELERLKNIPTIYSVKKKKQEKEQQEKEQQQQQQQDQQQQHINLELDTDDELNQEKFFEQLYSQLEEDTKMEFPENSGNHNDDGDDHDNIPAYRYYDRSLLTTQNAAYLELSRRYWYDYRQHDSSGRPRILFKLPANMEPRLAILFAKFCTLHGVDGLVVGGEAFHHEAFFQPSLNPQHNEAIHRNLFQKPIVRRAELLSLCTPKITHNTSLIQHFDREVLQKTPEDVYIPISAVPVTIQPGYITGTPLRDMSTRLIATIYHHTQGMIPIIGSGGIFTGQDAFDKITAGASLVTLNSALYYNIKAASNVRSELSDIMKHQRDIFFDAQFQNKDQNNNISTNIDINQNNNNNNNNESIPRNDDVQKRLDDILAKYKGGKGKNDTKDKKQKDDEINNNNNDNNNNKKTDDTFDLTSIQRDLHRINVAETQKFSINTIVGRNATQYALYQDEIDLVNTNMAQLTTQLSTIRQQFLDLQEQQIIKSQNVSNPLNNISINNNNNTLATTNNNTDNTNNDINTTTNTKTDEPNDNNTLISTNANDNIIVKSNNSINQFTITEQDAVFNPAISSTPQIHIEIPQQQHQEQEQQHNIQHNNTYEDITLHPPTSSSILIHNLQGSRDIEIDNNNNIGTQTFTDIQNILLIHNTAIETNLGQQDNIENYTTTQSHKTTLNSIQSQCNTPIIEEPTVVNYLNDDQVEIDTPNILPEVNANITDSQSSQTSSSLTGTISSWAWWLLGY